MQFKIKLSETKDYICLDYFGNVTNDDLTNSIAGCTQLYRETGVSLYLADCTDMHATHSILDIFGKVDAFESLEMKKDFKEALIVTRESESREKLNFYETACLNRGYNVRVFESKEDALQWLLKGKKKI
ncbi:MAG TPA: hypothetical protein PKA39_10165 [Ignavibacteria bacterium]|nr:hypothetical protein [Ignavibacteria bacterium]